SAAGHSSRLPADRVEVDVFERAVADLDAVDLLARPDQLGDDPRRVLPGRALEGPHPGAGLDLDRRRPRQPRRRSRLDQAAAGDDRDVVADELDLAEQVGVEKDGDLAAAQLLEQLAD